MPIYSFECSQCKNQFDEMVSYHRRDETRCPACGGESRVKVSAFAVQGGGGGGGGGFSAPSGGSGFS